MTAVVANSSRRKQARNPSRGSKKGERRGGRKKGTPNKLSATLKEAILAAAEQAHPDGTIGYLQLQATTNPVAFMSLLGRVLPLTVSNDPDNPFEPPQFIVQPVMPAPVKGE